jgi:CDP-glucose 4,6-dehydratase
VTVLVTGGQGFIGSWLVSGLLDRGDSVAVLRRPLRDESRFAREGLHECTLAADADLTDRASLARVLAEYEVDTVFHLAAQTLVGPANDAPAATFAVNVDGTVALMEACRLNSSRMRAIVVASSYHVYGRHDGRPYTEALALRATFPYDVSKACTDLIARSYGTTYRLPVAVLRLANVFGAGDLQFSRLVPDAARALTQGQRPVIRSDGTPERDFLYVEDATDAYLAVADALDDPSLAGTAWNAGSGHAISILDLIGRLVAVSGVDVAPDVRGQRQPRDDVDRQVLDSSAIRERVGWAPRHDLDAGLRKTWDWYARQGGRLLS